MNRRVLVVELPHQPAGQMAYSIATWTIEGPSDRVGPKLIPGLGDYDFRKAQDARQVYYMFCDEPEKFSGVYLSEVTPGQYVANPPLMFYREERGALEGVGWDEWIVQANGGSGGLLLAGLVRTAFLKAGDEDISELVVVADLHGWSSEAKAALVAIEDDFQNMVLEDDTAGDMVAVPPGAVQTISWAEAVVFSQCIGPGRDDAAGYAMCGDEVFGKRIKHDGKEYYPIITAELTPVRNDQDREVILRGSLFFLSDEGVSNKEQAFKRAWVDVCEVSFSFGAGLKADDFSSFRAIFRQELDAKNVNMSAAVSASCRVLMTPGLTREVDNSDLINVKDAWGLLDAGDDVAQGALVCALAEEKPVDLGGVSRVGECREAGEVAPVEGDRPAEGAAAEIAIEDAVEAIERTDGDRGRLVEGDDIPDLTSASNDDIPDLAGEITDDTSDGARNRVVDGDGNVAETLRQGAEELTALYGDEIWQGFEQSISGLFPEDADGAMDDEQVAQFTEMMAAEDVCSLLKSFGFRGVVAGLKKIGCEPGGFKRTEASDQLVVLGERLPKGGIALGKAYAIQEVAYAYVDQFVVPGDEDDGDAILDGLPELLGQIVWASETEGMRPYLAWLVRELLGAWEICGSIAHGELLSCDLDNSFELRGLLYYFAELAANDDLAVFVQSNGGALGEDGEWISGILDAVGEVVQDSLTVDLSYDAVKNGLNVSVVRDVCKAVMEGIGNET